MSQLSHSTHAARPTKNWVRQGSKGGGGEIPVGPWPRLARVAQPVAQRARGALDMR